MRDLEIVLTEMQAAAESRREIERQHREALDSLKRKQEEVNMEHNTTTIVSQILFTTN